MDKKPVTTKTVKRQKSSVPETRVTKKQDIFCRSFALYGDHVRAWVDAGFRDVSTKSNYNHAKRLATRTDIKRQINLYQQVLIEKANLAEQDVITELKEIGFSNMADFLDDKGNLLPLNNIPREKMSAVKSIRRTKNKAGVHTTIILHEKNFAIDKLAKMLNMYERNNLSAAPKIVLTLGQQSEGQVYDAEDDNDN